MLELHPGVEVQLHGFDDFASLLPCLSLDFNIVRH